ncbi:MAG: enoyl-CoA hydratase/isomerase family protein, partial [Acetobacteraceae bacterium]
MSTDDTLITSRDGRIARILLNRPRALNALNLDMIRAMTKALTEWRDDPHVHAVVITGAGDRAFCAGGDVINLREGQLSGDRTEVEAFFGEEYDLNYMIATYPKPYIALIDGICMGGGIGVSVYGPYRVATEHASFGMPETAIGFFPDIGGTYFMPRMPGELGMYLGLTGLRISGADSVHAGFATHYTPREDLPALSAALAKEGPAALARFNRTLPAYSLEPHLADIDAIFGTDSVVEMVQQLEKRDADWAKAALKAMRTVSPSALCWTVEALRRGADMTLRQALDAE